MRHEEVHVVVQGELLPIGDRSEAGRALGAAGIHRGAAAFRDGSVEIDYIGLNHLGWLRGLVVDGEDVLPRLLADAGAIESFEEGRLFGAAWIQALGAVPNEYLHYYYFHRVSGYEFGDLDRWDTSASHFRFHSPRQVQVEFLADLAEMSHGWVPTAVSVMARNYGNLRLANEFVNAVGYRIGDPRPW